MLRCKVWQQAVPGRQQWLLHVRQARYAVNKAQEEGVGGIVAYTGRHVGWAQMFSELSTQSMEGGKGQAQGRRQAGRQAASGSSVLSE